MTKQTLISLSFLFLILFNFSTTLAESPAQAPSKTKAQAPSKTKAQAPSKHSSQTPAEAPAKPLAQPPSQPQPPAEAPSQEPLVQAPPSKTKPEPTNVTRILEKANGFSVFIRLLRSTQVINQIENQLNASSSLTIFAPINGAFSSLKPGTLNTLNTEQKVQLIQYHIIPSFISISNFQTLSNPVRTQASDTREYPLNITTEGNWVNISTGLVDATISGTIYSDGQLGIYRVDKVLLPFGIFAPRPKAPAPAPALAKGKPKETELGSGSGSGSGSDSTSSSPTEALNASGAVSVAGNEMLSIGVALVVGVVSLQAQFDRFALW
ncbi:hypothetical protein UlMin_013695 [Ulmus minor]